MANYVRLIHERLILLVLSADGDINSANTAIQSKNLQSPHLLNLLHIIFLKLVWDDSSLNGMKFQWFTFQSNQESILSSDNSIDLDFMAPPFNIYFCVLIFNLMSASSYSTSQFRLSF